MADETTQGESLTDELDRKDDTPESERTARRRERDEDSELLARQVAHMAVELLTPILMRIEGKVDECLGRIRQVEGGHRDLRTGLDLVSEQVRIGDNHG